MSETTPDPVQSNPSSSIDAEVDREVNAALGDKTYDQLMNAAAPAPIEPDAPQKSTKQSHHRTQTDLRRGRVSAVKEDQVFVELAGIDGKNEGIVPLAQFDRTPRVGSIMEFVVDRFDETEGLFILTREGAVGRATWDSMHKGSVIEARCVSTNKGGLEMEVAGGIRAFMPASQVDMHHTDDMEQFISQKLQAVVVEIDHRSRKIVLSRRKHLEQQREVLSKKLWETIEVGQTIDGVVRSIMEYGVFVDIGGADGMIHVSDLSHRHIDKPADAVKTGQKVTVKVLKLDPEKQRISLGLKQVMPDPWEGFTERLHVGDQISGRVTSITNFGAFIEVEPGVEGLIPLSEMSWKRIGRASDVAKEGSVLAAVVLHIDAEKRRITLSMKQVQGDPWQQVESKYAANSLVEAKVVRITEFGAFVELEPGVDGLVHISELSDRRVGAVDEVVKVGDVRQFRVLDVDLEKRRVRLSIKAVENPRDTQAQSQGHGHGQGQSHGRSSGAAVVAPAKLGKKKKMGKLKGGIE